MLSNCPHLQELIVALLADESSVRDRARWHRHLAECRHCAADHKALSTVVDMARQIAVPEPADSYWRSFSPELRRRLDRGSLRGRALRLAYRLQPCWRPALAASVLLALVLGGVEPVRLRAPADGSGLAGLVTGAQELSRAIDPLTTMAPLAVSVGANEVPYALSVDAASAHALAVPAPLGAAFDFLGAVDEMSPREALALFAKLDSEFLG